MYIHEAQYVIPPSDSVKEPFCRLAFWGSFFLFFFALFRLWRTRAPVGLC